jgi:uncharacterized protein
MENVEEFIDTSGVAPVRGFLHRPREPKACGLVLTHGAGANCRSPLLTLLADAFCAAGCLVLRCDLVFRQTRPFGPPPRGSAERDQEGLSAAVRSLQPRVHGPVFVGGHSYGGRQASMLAAGHPGLIERLLLLSYPLHPPDKPADLRTKHFPALQTPCLFVQGTKDGFASIEEMELARNQIPAPTRLLAIAGAGHELMNKTNRAEVTRGVVEAFLSFAPQ